MSTVEELHHRNVKCFCVCGLCSERVLTSLGRQFDRESSAVFIDPQLQLELTCQKENETRALPRVLIVIYMTIVIGKVRNRSPLHLNHVRRLTKPLASLSALTTVSF